MTTMRALPLVLLLVLIPAQSFAELSGNELWGICDGVGEDPKEPLACFFYLAGAMNMHRGLMDSLVESELVPVRIICFPEGVTFEQKHDVVLKYLEEYPERRHFSASTTILAALGTAFPCKKD